MPDNWDQDPRITVKEIREEVFDAADGMTEDQCESFLSAAQAHLDYALAFTGSTPLELAWKRVTAQAWSDVVLWLSETERPVFSKKDYKPSRFRWLMTFWFQRN